MATAWSAPFIVGSHATYLQIDKIDTDYTLGGTGALANQLTWGPDGKLYVATSGNGVLRYDYNTATGALTNRTVIAQINAQGIAFHRDGSNRDVLYLTENDTINRRGYLTRLTDANGDGLYGGPSDVNVRIVNNIPIGTHGLTQLAISGNSLYVGIGTRSFNGGIENAPEGESAYNGNIAVIQNLNGVTDTLDAAGFGYAGNLTTDMTLANPYTSTAANKLINLTSGARHPAGIGIDPEAKLWLANQQRNPAANDGLDSDFSNNPHDQLLTGGSKADFGFANSNWRTNGTALANGYFNAANAKTSLTFDNLAGAAQPNFNPNTEAQTGLGMQADVAGLEFSTSNALPVQYHRDVFVTRTAGNPNLREVFPGTDTLEYSDIVAVDSFSGAVTLIADGFDDGNPAFANRLWSQPRDILQDSQGNMLIGTANDGFYRISKKANAPAVPAVHAFTWNTNASANWSVATNWNTDVPGVNVMPHQWGDQRHAVTISRPGANTIVTVDRDISIESLNLFEELSLATGKTLTTKNLMLGDFSNLGGAGTLTVTGTGGGLSIPAGVTSIKEGTSTINVTNSFNWGISSTWFVQQGTLNLNPTAPGTVGSFGLLVTDAATTVNVGGTADPFSQGLQKIVIVNNSPNFSITSGTKTVGKISGTGTIKVAAGASLTTEGLSQQGLQLLGTSAQVIASPQGGTAGAFILSNLTMQNGSLLDLNDNDLVLYYSQPGPNPALIQTITSYVDNFYTDNLALPRIGSTAMNNSGGNRILIPVDNSSSQFGDTGNPFLGLVLGNSSNPTNPGFNQVIIRFTYPGDYNLDGQVDGSDYLVVDSNIGSTTPGLSAGWTLGDGDFDGMITTADYSPIDTFFGSGVGNPLGLRGEAPISIPEPHALVAGGIAILLLAMRRQPPRRV
ncbi:MAG: hypothetical protein SFX18_06430 [Pirellulales bacterium]|nr:hypothetical protein [Pirellulales bacterium]